MLASLRKRGLGLIATAKKQAIRELVPDDVLVDRVRARLGHVSPHLGQIEVTSHDGVVTLEGTLSKAERAAREVSGVRAVVEQLGE
jgi:osmotically-inducible protein OsmY